MIAAALFIVGCALAAFYLNLRHARRQRHPLPLAAYLDVALSLLLATIFLFPTTSPTFPTITILLVACAIGAISLFLRLRNALPPDRSIQCGPKSSLPSSPSFSSSCPS